MITLLNSKIEEEILNHFELEFDITENQESFECIFEFDGAEITVPYEFKHELLIYKNEWIGARKGGVSYSIKDSEHFEIRRRDHNPNKKTLQQEIDSIIEHEERKAEENNKND